MIKAKPKKPSTGRTVEVQCPDISPSSKEKSTHGGDEIVMKKERKKMC